MFKKLFGKKDEEKEKEKAAAEKKKRREAEKRRQAREAEKNNDKPKSSSSSGGAKAKAPAAASTATKGGKSKKRKDKNKSGNVHVNTDAPIEFPCTPEIMLEYHKVKPFLTQNEEWLLVELNEFECLVDGMDIIKIIAKHSKFFEVDPDELWEEFFEYVEEMPSYDEVINYDVWQEFRDEKYPC